MGCLFCRELLGVCLENCEVFDRAECCKEFVRRTARYLIEWCAIRSSIEELLDI